MYLIRALENNSQFPRVLCGLVEGDGGLGGLAHDDDLLVGHHDHAGEAREPHTHAHETLEGRYNSEMRRKVDLLRLRVQTFGLALKE